MSNAVRHMASPLLGRDEVEALEEICRLAVELRSGTIAESRFVCDVSEVLLRLQPDETTEGEDYFF